MSRWESLQGILLDLDDTLYAERDYFHSGLAAVAAWLAEFDAETDHLAILLADVTIHGRAGALDRVALPGHLTYIDHAAWRKTLLQVYRNHAPKLALFDDVGDFLDRCRRHNCRLGLVTDGKSCVQWRKLWALKLDKLLDVVVVTDDIDAPKPSSVSFQIAAQRLGVRAEHCVYIADDASKDFIGPRELGMATVQLQRPLEWSLAKPAIGPNDEPDVRVGSLQEAAQLLFGDPS